MKEEKEEGTWNQRDFGYNKNNNTNTMYEAVYMQLIISICCRM